MFASRTAILVKNLPAWLTSPPPLEKKKLAPRPCSSNNLQTIVRAIVDLPVPAKQLSQKMHRSSCPSAQSYSSRSRSTRVLGRQVGSSWRSNELSGAPVANGRQSSPSSPVSARLEYRMLKRISTLALQRFVDLLPEPRQRLVSSFAIEEGDLDVENAK